MRVLFTSDWQCDYENLVLCKQVVDEILVLKKKHGFTHLVHCGDVKHAYNPLDGRVTNFVIRSTGKLLEAGLDEIIDLGNHDRFGMHANANWFPVLRKAGAKAYDEPKLLDLGDGARLGILPYRNDPVLLRREADDLAKRANPKNTVLVFHADIKLARYNVLSQSEAEISAEDLCPQRYMYCIGGHLHLQHKVVDNVWYVGSPFCTDWGEANQKKGYLLLDFKTKELTKIRSSIPGWYDPQWPGFAESKPNTWKGTRIRIKVKCGDTKHVGEALRNAKEEAEKTYKEAEILVVPELAVSANGKHSIRSDWPDKKKLERYGERTIPDELKPFRKKVLEFLAETLEQAGGIVREGGALRFGSVWAKNFLSFKELQMDFEPGLMVVAGQNKDWKGRSNGSGKTSCLMPLAVALFGVTFKGQKHNNWMRRGAGKKKKSFVAVEFKDAQDRYAIVWRGRQPKKLTLRINKELVDSGNRPEQTQRSIEQATGYTWETLANAVYIDQTRAHLMLTGTEGERKEFLARLQNLERFERAGKLIKGQKTDLEHRLNILYESIAESTAAAKNLEVTISQTCKILAIGNDPVARYKQAKIEHDKIDAELRAWEELARKQLESVDAQLAKYNRFRRDSERRLDQVDNKVAALEDNLMKFRRLRGKCPECGQEINEVHARKYVPALEEKLDQLVVDRDAINKKWIKMEKEEIVSLNQREKYRDNPLLRDSLEKAKLALYLAKSEKEQYDKQEELLAQLQARRKKALGVVEKQEAKAKKARRWMQVLAYGERVFARNGLPAYLNAQLCPELNQVAAEYAERFAQKEIQVVFAVDEEGRMDVQVVNAHGGEGVQDQSEGEMKIASLITSFAVRAIAPKTNLLILDEPGDGLDATSARQFARGLREVVGKFGTILLTSHNQAILSELSDSRMVTVVKENGVSRLEA